MNAVYFSALPSHPGVFRPSSFLSPKGSVFYSKPILPIKHYSSVLYSTPVHRRVNIGSKSTVAVRASSSSPGSARLSASIAPLQLESPVGQFLSQILVSHPHLVRAAVDQQLEQLQTDRDADKKKEEMSASGTELVLYRRISEIKANERGKALEEILYALIVQKFMDANVTLTPAITPCPDSSGRVDMWPSQDGKLEQLHSPEAYEMIQNHLSIILGNQSGDLTSVAQMSKHKVAQVYAASLVYGYFVKRVDQRYQLEKTMKRIPDTSDEETNIGKATHGLRESNQLVPSHPEVSYWAGRISPEGPDHGVKPYQLQRYVMSFDGETLRRYATLRSREALSIIGKHTEAVFGRPEIVFTAQGTVDHSKDELINISFGGLKALLLEAATFGSCLWDVESYVDLRYDLEMS